jgi:hypothetical protein
LPDLADAPAQVFITGGYNVALVLSHPLTQAVIGVCALVGAWDALYTRILNARRHNQQQKNTQSVSAVLQRDTCRLSQIDASILYHRYQMHPQLTQQLQITSGQKLPWLYSGTCRNSHKAAAANLWQQISQA